MADERKQLIQDIINKKKYTTYLEIGVFAGGVFFPVRAKRKIAVDPEFTFGKFKRRKKILKNLSNLNARYYEMPSDDFFNQHAGQLFKDNAVDICLVDGMHEYEYALRDVENTLHYLQQDGVIIMHDCNPQTAAAAISFEEWKNKNYEGNWNGDVWKTILHLRSLRKDITVFVLDVDYGLGIVCKRPPEDTLSFTPAQIRNFTYDDLAKNRQQWLNLKPIEYFYRFFNL
ncbi:MAG: class I SAM-dependent methyltransferase [Bacteroidota bacterium]|nr:class I SAM-dependent methyltransferase [Bacteroidota bacterium]